jgi:hypothetical protein
VQTAFFLQLSANWASHQSQMLAIAETRLFQGAIEPLLEASGFTHPFTQVVQLCPPGFTATYDLNVGNSR